MRKPFPYEEPESYKLLSEIDQIAQTGASTVVSMGSQKKIPFSLDDFNFVPAQIAKIPLNSNQPINTAVTIGPHAKKPLTVSSPIMFSAMSYGAVTKNVRLILTQVASNLNLAVNTGEELVLPEVELATPNLIVQYSTVRTGLTEEILKSASAVEIRFGQGAYPGWRSLLPAAKIPDDIRQLRGLAPGQDEHDLASHPDIQNPAELAAKIRYLKGITDGVPVGAKIGCGNIEADLEILVSCGVDFVSLDGFGAGTGATERFARENLGIPLIVAISRARRYLAKTGNTDKVSLIAGGGLRTSADFAKCLALGADAIYTGTATLIALGCQQYRICHTGNCPRGVTSSKPELSKLLDVAEGVRRLTNFVKVSTAEMANIARIVGKYDLRLMDIEDLVALKRDAAQATGVRWLNGEVL